MMKFPQLIKGYPIGSDITILDCVYRYPYRDEETYKFHPDTMTILFKDNVTKEKHFRVIENPQYAYYFRDPDLYGDPGYNQFFESEEYLKLIRCDYKDLNKSLASILGYSFEWYEANKKDKDALKKILVQDRRIFGSDIDINDFYRMRFAEQYKNEDIPVSIAFMDIETDNAQIGGKFPEKGNCPVNAISYFDKDTKELYTLLLDTKNNPLIEKFSNEYNDEEFNNNFKVLLNDVFGGFQVIEKYKLNDIKTHVYMYTSEIDLITDFFNFVNIRRPDFLLAWNMAFDLPFLIDRIGVLGYNPEDIICSPEFPIKKCKYIIDEQHIEFAEKGDNANITSFTIYLDQLIQFASRRKGTKFRNYKLDSIGEEIAKIRKLNYSDLTQNIWELPYLDYNRFVMYNMVDVLVQYCIEFCTDDIPYMFSKALMNCVQYRKVHRQTIYLADRAIVRFMDYGNYVMGNNVNKFKPKPNDKYEGAFVADPILNSDKNKVHINGVPINMYKNVIDYDFKRLYPSETQEYGMAPNTLIGKIDIPNRVYENENGLHNPKYTRAGQFVEDFTSNNPLEFCRRWLHLGSFREVYLDIFEYFDKYEESCIPIQDDIIENKLRIVSIRDENKKISPAIILSDETKHLLETEIPNLSKEEKERIINLIEGDN